MGKIKKKGTTGSAKNFITRTQAVRKLQITLPDFRRLCIFKGIYPREPRNKKKASKSSTPSTTFYYTKDIQYLLHEPLLRKFREHKTLAKKISKALGRGEVSDAARLEKNHTPRLSLDHVIKERYPTFVDALRDLDDALSMLFLFANLPSTTTVPPKTIGLCQRLCLEFQHYLITTNSLRKSFLSIKGIYYQATIQGQDILWLVPYRFVQRVTGDVDFRIMGTFVEFYSTLLGFVNFRLYTSIGLVYPPKFSQASDDRGGELRALTLEARGIGAPAIDSSADTNGDAQEAITANGHIDATTKAKAGAAEIDSVVRQIAAMDHEPTPGPTDSTHPELTANEPAPGDDNAIDTFTAPIASDGDVLPQPSTSTERLSTLFTPLTVYLSRETPRQPLEFLLRAFGCKRIAWDPVLGDGSYTHDEHDPAITHQVVDRPVLPHDPTTANAAAIASRTIVPGRIYIQPQWVWDCANDGRLLRPDLYAPGAELPPHLSPWVKPTHGVYDPTAPLAEQELEGEAEEAEDEDVTPDDELDSIPIKDNSEVDADAIDGGMDIAGTDSSSDSDTEARPSEWTGLSSPASHDDVNEGEEDATILHQRELAAELTGAPLPSATASTKEAAEKAARKKAAAKKRKEKAEELERQKMMMSRKKRKVLDKMLYGNERKEEVARELRGKRRRLEGEKAK